jgi:hypothetical protein
MRISVREIVDILTGVGDESIVSAVVFRDNPRLFDCFMCVVLLVRSQDHWLSNRNNMFHEVLGGG